MNAELKSIQQFFTERRKRCLSVNAIEIEAKLPAKTLSHFLKGRRLLNSEHLDTLIPVLVDFGYKPVSGSFLCALASEKRCETQCFTCSEDQKCDELYTKNLR